MYSVLVQYHITRTYISVNISNINEIIEKSIMEVATTNTSKIGE